MLHIIDAVLEPLCPINKQDSLAYMHLTAGKLLREKEKYYLGGHSIRCVSTFATETSTLYLTLCRITYLQPLSK